jgi:hypothetical protein
MKIIIFISFIILTLNSQILVYPNGKTEIFDHQLDKSRTMKNRIYYKNSIKSRKTQYQDTRKIYVSFGKKVNIDNFTKKYHLQVLKLTNDKFYTYIFKILDNSDVISLCSKININENIRYAKPNWKAPKYLK